VNELCNKLDIKWFLSVLDKPSYDFIKELNPSMIKLPSTISEHKDYLKAVANDFKGDLVISTGFTEKGYEKFLFLTLLAKQKIFIYFNAPQHILLQWSIHKSES
jgi:sialic acid synthase SpsE